jgi:uncharacterized cupredoxin-like copper-binding protein
MQPASAATAIDVQLTDKGLDANLATGLAYGTPGADKAKAAASVKLSRNTAPAGQITFNVTNSSKEMVHEMLVVVANPGKPLPYDAKSHEINEDVIVSKGEVPELDPGKTGKLTVTLQPGTYLLLCNVAGHYDGGMWATFTVTK